MAAPIKQHVPGHRGRHTCPEETRARKKAPSYPRRTNGKGRLTPAFRPEQRLLCRVTRPFRRAVQPQSLQAAFFDP